MNGMEKVAKHLEMTQSVIAWGITPSSSRVGG